MINGTIVPVKAKVCDNGTLAGATNRILVATNWILVAENKTIASASETVVADNNRTVMVGNETESSANRTVKVAGNKTVAVANRTVDAGNKTLTYTNGRLIGIKPSIATTKGIVANVATTIIGVAVKGAITIVPTRGCCGCRQEDWEQED